MLAKSFLTVGHELREQAVVNFEWAISSGDDTKYAV
jgi:hypothetical protein